MKYLVNAIRFFVGGLFIFSGFIKLNDPVGFSFKLQEYFSEGVLNLPLFEPYAFIIGLLVLWLEIMLGVFIILGIYKKPTLYLTLGLIVFFTFLTFYSAYYNKVTDCGCFGDAIKLTPWESFSKDVLLTILIVILFVFQKLIAPLFSKMISIAVYLVSWMGILIFSNHVITGLPVKDFRAYKIGTDIKKDMSSPEDAPKDVYEDIWYYKVGGEKKSFKTSEEPWNISGAEFIDRETKLIKKGYQPPIHDLSIENDSADIVNEVLEKEKVYWVVSYDFNKSEKKGFQKIKETIEEKGLSKQDFIILSATPQDVVEKYLDEIGLNIPVYFTDETSLKTMIRSNPGIMETQKGIIEDKWNWRDF